MKKNLTEFYVHNAMIDFLYGFEKRRYGYGTLQEILRELSPLSEGGTSNPAIWVEWNRHINKCLKETIIKKPFGETAYRIYTNIQSFNAMVEFLLCYYKKTLSGDLHTLINAIYSLSKNTTNTILQSNWDNAAKKALQKEVIKESANRTMEKRLTELQAFNAMVEFLGEYYKKTSSDLICLLLGDMLFWPDGNTIDPAAWIEWDDAVRAILKKEAYQKSIDKITSIILTEQQSFQAMVQLFKNYYELTSNVEATEFLDSLHLLPNNNSNHVVEKKWKICVDNALKERPGIRGYRIECRGG